MRINDWVIDKIFVEVGYIKLWKRKKVRVEKNKEKANLSEEGWNTQKWI